MTPCRTTAVWLWLKHGLQSKISLVKSHDLFNARHLVIVFSYCSLLFNIVGEVFFTCTFVCGGLFLAKGKGPLTCFSQYNYSKLNTMKCIGN